MANEKTFVRGRWSFFEGPTPIVLTELTKADLEVAVGRIAFSICPANLLPWIRLDVSTTLWLFNVVAVDFNGLDLCLVALALYFQSNSLHSRTPFLFLEIMLQRRPPRQVPAAGQRAAGRL